MGKRIKFHKSYEALQARADKALSQKPSIRGNKDVKSFLSLLKSLNRKKPHATREKSIVKLDKELTSRTEKVAIAGWKKMIADKIHVEETSIMALKNVSDRVLAGDDVPGFTLLPTEKALINKTVTPLVSFKNKYKEITLCVYNSYLEETTVEEFYERAAKNSR